jgi:hypothetical protein
VTERLDPKGKRALFEAPVTAPPDQLRAGVARQGRDALFSVGRAEPGTVVLGCSTCRARSRVAIADLGVRLLTGSLVWPGRRDGWFVRCPACDHRTWCSVSFRT